MLWVWAIIVLIVSVCPGNAADTLRIGTLPVVDTLPLLVGQAEDLFAEQGLRVELTPFQSALERDAALQSGKLDGYFGDLLNTILLIRSGQKLKIVTTAFHTHPRHRMFGIATAPGSGAMSPADLKGRQVAISRATIIEYLLDRIMAAEGFGPDHVAKLEIKKIPVRLQMLLADQVPAALLPEPLLTLAESKGAHVVADDRRLDTSETILALDAGRISGDATLASRFLTAYRQAVDRINRDPEAYKTLLVERTRFPLPVQKRFRVPVFPDPQPPSPEDVAAVQDWLQQNGLIETRLVYDSVVWTDQP
jgi:NitT/TauT family transport system substrate-binding protein